MADVIRVPPFYFLHVLDANKSITRVERGPKTFVREDHEKVLLGPEPMIIIPPRNYCIVSNPVVRAEDGSVVTDGYGQAKLQHGDQEIRFTQEPFPLYPGEQLAQKVTPLQVLPPNRALHLRSIRDFVDPDSKKKRQAGDEWLLEGPCTYIPRVDVEIVATINAIILGPNQALLLRAKREFVDRQGKTRKAGEEWLWTEEGAYIPLADEEVIKTVKSMVLTDKNALHLSAKRTFVDPFGKERKAGSEWLVTNKETSTYTPGVFETLVGEVPITTLSKQQYCIVLDPLDPHTGEPQLGKRELRKGELSFFLRPGESMPGGVRKVHVLGEEDGVLVRALLPFEDKRPGDKWMITGPCEYIPPVEVDIIETRRVIPLDENEGIYVRDTQTGKVRAVIGQSYMLKPFEELWAKELPPAVEALLNSDFDPLADRSGQAPRTISARDKTAVVKFRVPHNAAVQVYDYKENKARIVFGPELVLLGPDDQFTMLNLSGGRPKKEKAIRSLVLLLGPDFMTDVITVETADHARLALTLAYNWKFDVDRHNAESAARLFSVPDFVGTACKAIASRVRGSVAQIPFDEFHRESAGLIRHAVFGSHDTLTFPANNLVITSIDIQSVEPVDQKTRDSLMKSVQLAIEITTTSQEATARHEAERREQEAKGKLERQRIQDEAAAEKERANLLQLQAMSAAIESTGHSKAEARARAEAGEIQGSSAVNLARLRAQASKIQADAELAQTLSAQAAELEHSKSMDLLDISKAERLAQIESTKFKAMVTTIGPDTIQSIARAGPEMQAKLLSGLGVQSLLITDGNSPINLFNTANGLVGVNPALQK
eukprot:c9301_g1_i1.p1 GENE.c9301_g1_i1~~c9301_g1_i1.p1  ORF type:complete len:847 (-),score=185.09 c9301_g1_i1:53-2536(-)